MFFQLETTLHKLKNLKTQKLKLHRGFLKQGCTTGDTEGCEGGNDSLDNGVEDGYPGRFFLGFGHGVN